MGLSRDKIISYISDGAIELRNGIRDRYDADMEDAYYEGLEEGISKTLSALYEADVKDDEIIRVMNKIWAIPEQDVEKMLLKEKIHATTSALRRYLRRNGKTEEDIRSFMSEYSVMNKIRTDSNLWKLRKQPEKLIKALKDN
ncbi:hypothetical protein SAMN02910298_00201 [Pseudobutyrivibrio sp. YE44]|uniref:hypothetical protein n=1 Tax=Pseudobutyrivibrio sp. YE44 TaxID=1520802 RepID=UPI000887CE1F|nr:hypothetical protein [Pseudobutyrivibrio sp. YE44]SDB06793.1 hypothetical protein SAMN02910298_00201 [Pseudobutyrivibrio sp. YE44]